jgi:scyllo-inositol 2-dehydrogenase (NADP+)
LSQVIRVGLVGYGFAGRTFHAPVISAVPNLELAKVVQRSSSTSKERYPWVEVVGDVRDLYEDDAIDLIVITTPSPNHYEFVRDALLAGKHVVVEKPFTTTTAEADELIELARANGKVLSVFHNRRWDGDYQTVKKIVNQGLLGQLSEVEFRWERYSPISSPGRWRNGTELGSGVFYDLGVHFLDQAVSLFGTPQTIRADIKAQREGAVADDYFDVDLGYDSGLKVSLKASLLVHDPGPRYSLHGSNGSFRKYGEDPQENALKAGKTPASPNWGMEPREDWGTLNTTLDGLRITGQVQTIPGAYQAYFQNVYEAITGTSELAVKPEQARMAIRLIELGIQSSTEQRTVAVTL